MVATELVDEIVWIIVKGELTARDITRQVGPWLAKKDSFRGFITDLRQMTPIPSPTEQKNMEDWRQQNRSGKPHALLGRTNALGALTRLYVTFTKAKDTRYFLKPEAAIAWIMDFDGPAK